MASHLLSQADIDLRLNDGSLSHYRAGQHYLVLKNGDGLRAGDWVVPRSPNSDPVTLDPAYEGWSQLVERGVVVRKDQVTWQAVVDFVYPHPTDLQIPQGTNIRLAIDFSRQDLPHPVVDVEASLLTWGIQSGFAIQLTPNTWQAGRRIVYQNRILEAGSYLRVVPFRQARVGSMQEAVELLKQDPTIKTVEIYSDGDVMGMSRPAGNPPIEPVRRSRYELLLDPLI